MMQLRWIMAALAVLIAFAIGWATPPDSDPPVAPVSMLRLHTAVIAEPGQRARYAADYLARLNPPPPPPKPLTPPRPPAPPPAPPPPPPDVSSVLRAALTAVVQEGNGELALVLTEGAGAGGRRVLRRGDTFGDGWRIASITRRQTILQRGAEQRVVSLFDAPAGA